MKTTGVVCWQKKMHLLAQVLHAGVGGDGKLLAVEADNLRSCAVHSCSSTIVSSRINVTPMPERTTFLSTATELLKTVIEPTLLGHAGCGSAELVTAPPEWRACRCQQASSCAQSICFAPRQVLADNAKTSQWLCLGVLHAGKRLF